MDWYDPRGRWTVAWSRLLRGDLGDFRATIPQNPWARCDAHAQGRETTLSGATTSPPGLTAVYELNRDFQSRRINLNLILGVRADLR